MPRVVCPMCRTGFEATVSRENPALNCVSCGVAFNAAHYLRLEEGTRSFSEPAATTTRTGGLPFMSETGAAGQKLASAQSGGATPLPVPLKGSAAAVAVEVAPATHVMLSKTGQPRPHSGPEVVSVEAPAPGVAVAEMATSAMNLDKAAEAEKKRKTTRRPLLEGKFGPYEIEGEIARGGVGAVFKARARDTGKMVALKVLLDGDEAGDADRERFRHECETAKSLSLPGMVQVYEVGEVDNRPYMAMELVSGRSLDKVIPEKTLSVNDCLVLMKSVADTIGALHEGGYVHRDLKPGNILIDAFGSPKVADFGLVKSLDEVTRLTASGLVCGTPAYMAPEQARGDGKAVDPRSDVWALGAVLYEMLSGEPAFKAENALRLMLRITKDQPKPLRTRNMKVPAEVEAIVLKCLEKNPAKRYPNARALAENIGHFLNGEPLAVSTQPRVQQWTALVSANHRLLVSAGALVAALAVVAVLVHFLMAPKKAGPLAEDGFTVLNDRALKDSERLDKAEKIFRDALAADDKQGRAHLGLGLCLARRGIDPQTWHIVDQKKVNDAVAETGRASELDPTLQAECHAQIAKFNYWMKQYPGEAAEWERAVQQAPENLKYREALGIAYWNAGAQTNASRFYENAVREFQTILKTQPDYPKVREYIKLLQDRYLIRDGKTVSLVNPAKR